MRDEPYHRHQPPWRLEMPHISIPIQTVPINVRPGAQPPSVTTVSLPGTTGFVLGADTCGFTTSSTITCDSGYECSNVGNYRGCCSPGDEGCAATIYMECVDYEDVGYSADCGAHTLCCPQTNPFCFTYAFMTQNEPGTTFTHVQCNPSDGFGEMFPFPPELMTATSAEEPSETNSSADDDSSSHSTPTGAIVGAVVGSAVLLILIIVAAILLLRRRRLNRRRAALNVSAQSGTAKTPQSSANDSPSLEKEHAQTAAAAAMAASKKRTRRSLLRPLSLIREHPSPVEQTTSTPAREKHKTVAVGSASRRSFGPNWPLGSPNGNPLGAHPIDADLKKRLSDSRLGARIPDSGVGIGRSSSSGQAARVPILQLPTPPPPGTKPAPLPLPPRSPRSPRISGGSGTPTSATAALQSPRLSYVPVSPIEAVAFGDNADKGVSRALGQINGDNTATARPRSVTPQTDEPVSPIESDGDRNEVGEVDEDAQRLSYVSAPSAPGDVDRDELVSPVSPEAGSDAEDDGGNRSLGLVSPLEGSRPRTMGF
ncbi:hypothetical protein GGR53DRAFT_39296 [Hypoxylon sp. FL1150]|nr:hypothetical protein GGR53DRAFT_39296 [Hypoxylon sp. FL1150]